MSTPRRLGVVLCLLGFLAVCVLALVLSTSGPFAGLPGIEDDLAASATELVEADAPGAVVTAEGRNVSVRLPEIVNSTFNATRLEQELGDIDGVRSVELIGSPTIAVDPDDAPVPEPTVAADPTAVPEPTAEPEPTATAVPTAEPSATEEPTEEPSATAVPTEEPTATPEPPDLADVVQELNSDAIGFESGSALLTAQDIATLDGIADRLQALDAATVEGIIEVQAHTDNVGDPDVNLLLSQQRAEAVVDYLIDRGVAAELLRARGYGAELPIADNGTEQGRAANQRVAFVVEGN